MKNLFELSFWKAVIIYLFAELFYGFIYVVTKLIFRNLIHPDIVQFLLLFLPFLAYLPVIFIVAKKQKNKLKDQYCFPDMLAVKKMLLIIILARFIVLLPLWEPITFINILDNSHLKLNSSSIRPFFPLLDFRLIILVPIIEELFFRGIILRAFLKRYSPLYAILLSSVIFGLHHTSLENLFFYIALGIILGILYYAYRSLSICTLAHIIWNASSFFREKTIELSTSNSIILLGIYILALYALVVFMKKLYEDAPYSAINK